ncbi:matrixin family metalloprotease [Streptomyces sp. BE147]|uniref:matrixin family metalloprotease n=1 Tax=Streptomyces sp. BE147 TaxID=3002524 RepID=UPI002E77C8A2|nr:matrixin family metalloprotease [Streptomyces sp. BE147]MEE1741177.1 matrixin family metalloprotease [Streptomyces sp. BE147]
MAAAVAVLGALPVSDAAERHWNSKVRCEEADPDGRVVPTRYGNGDLGWNHFSGRHNIRKYRIIDAALAGKTGTASGLAVPSASLTPQLRRKHRRFGIPEVRDGLLARIQAFCGTIAGICRLMTVRTDSLALAASSAAVVLLAIPAPVCATAAARPHTCVDGRPDSRGRSSVDGRELAWDDASKFDDARRHAVKVWTAGTLKQVKIKPDSATSYADLEWRDANSTAADWHLTYGRWDPNTGTDYLWLNRAYLDARKVLGTNGHRRRVAAHELGHALGFCHKSFAHHSVMWEDYDNIATKKTNGPTSNDVTAYHALWG